MMLHCQHSSHRYPPIRSADDECSGPDGQDGYGNEAEALVVNEAQQRNSKAGNADNKQYKRSIQVHQKQKNSSMRP